MQKNWPKISDIYADILCKNINNSINSSLLSSYFKTADITPMYKKKVRNTLKEIINELVAILTVLSKLYEKILFKQIASFFEKYFSKNYCGFSKGCNTPQSLLVKRCADGVLAFGYLLTELLKVFDCLDHERIIAKLNSYEFSWLGLKLTRDYLSNRKQRKRENNSYIKWLSIMFGVAQASIRGPLLFNIFLGNLFVLH